MKVLLPLSPVPEHEQDKTGGTELETEGSKMMFLTQWYGMTCHHIQNISCEGQEDEETGDKGFNVARKHFEPFWCEVQSRFWQFSISFA